MAENKRKAGILAGLVAVVAGLTLAFKKAEPPLPEPPEKGVIVALKDAPGGANKWHIHLIDWDITRTIDWGVDAHNNIGEMATFEIPEGWAFPLRVDIGVYEEWQENQEWYARQLYRAQSYRPYLWDWEKWDWGDKPDPDYRDVFIPKYGSYYYNVTKERFE